MSGESSGEAVRDEAPVRVHELREKLDTIQWVAHVAMLAFAGYRRVLSDDGLRRAVFPQLGASNPRIQHIIEPEGVAFVTSLKEVSAPQNHDLYKAWQILGALSAMTAILDNYLRRYAWERHEVKISSFGVLDRVKKEGVLPTAEFPDFGRLRHFQGVRNISHHNLARINQRFRDMTAEQDHPDGPYVFFPRHINEYRDLILAFVDWCELRPLDNG